MPIPRILAAVALAFAAIAADGPPPGLTVATMYTAAQARDGLAVYTLNCAKCHSATLAGGSAPDLFGKSFTASRLTMSGLNREVTHEMPLDNPAGLSATQYAAVLAFLLAANCYPAGATAYPADGTIPNRSDKVATQGLATEPCTVK